jgi:hypothetical protein
MTYPLDPIHHDISVGSYPLGDKYDLMGSGEYMPWSLNARSRYRAQSLIHCDTKVQPAAIAPDILQQRMLSISHRNLQIPIT